MRHTFISLGAHCRPAFHLQRRGEQTGFPLDWLRSPQLSLTVDLILSDFQDFTNPAYLEPKTQGRPGWRHTRYGLEFLHDTLDATSWRAGDDLPAWMSRLDARVERFRRVVTEQPVIFIREYGCVAELSPLLVRYPRAKVLLINIGPMAMLERTDRVEVWNFPGSEPDIGPASWVAYNAQWDAVLDGVQEWASAGI